MTNRKIKEAGLNPLLGYLLALTAFLLLSEYIFHKTEFAKYLVILTCLNIQFKLSEKNRTDFLLSTFGDKTKMKIRVIENFIVCTPFVSILIYKSFLFEASILFICSAILALFSFHSNFNLTIPTPFSKRPFEFSTGFRKTLFIFPFAYVLTFIAINVDNLNLGIFAFLLIFLTSLSYYHKPEQEYYVWVHAETPKAFLKNKIFNASKNVTLIAAPIIISLLVFYPSEFELILLFFIIGLLFLCTVILAKYSAYPNEMNIPEGITIAFSLYFPPLLLAIIPFFYSKSVNKLKYILND
ncbi:MAG: ABC transporter permease [Saprospiraceae bacterium]|nr:ABC transporter permease [Saprospiraceae bacterium]